MRGRGGGSGEGEGRRGRKGMVDIELVSMTSEKVFMF